MLAIGFRYLSIVAALAFIFVNFIACGAQLYQVFLARGF